MNSTRAYVALWIGLAVVIAAVGWTFFNFGFALARAHQQPTIVIVNAAPGTVTCSPASACQVMPWPAPAGAPGAEAPR